MRFFTLILFLWPGLAWPAVLTQRVIQFDKYKFANRITDDAVCLDQILRNIDQRDSVLIQFVAREYHFTTLVQIFDWPGKVQFEGQEGSVFRVDGAWLQASALHAEQALTSALKRGSHILPGTLCPTWASLIKLSSLDTVELAWSYRASDLSYIRCTSAAGTWLADSINFSYDPLRTSLTFYAEASIILKGIHFISNHAVGPFLTLKGMQVEFENCAFTTLADSPMDARVSLLDCYHVVGNRIKISGPGNYGFLINGSRRVHFSDIMSSDCLYPIVPATFTTDVLVERLHCQGSVIDSHPSFEVTYRDVTIEDGSQYWNCRALGVVLENCHFEVQAGISDLSIYLGVVNLSEPYAFLYQEYDVVCKNVTWLYADQGFNGLHVHRCRDFLVEGCSTHAVSTGFPIRRFTVVGSTVGRVYGADSNFSVHETHFDGRLQGKLPIQPPLSGSYGGHMVIEGCDFTGYNATNLIRYIQDPNTRVEFRKCHIGEIIGLVDRTYMDREEYKLISMSDCTYDGEAEIRVRSFPWIKVEK